MSPDHSMSNQLTTASIPLPTRSVEELELLLLSPSLPPSSHSVPAVDPSHSARDSTMKKVKTREPRDNEQYGPTSDKDFKIQLKLS